jgi:hypothetical protein
MTNEQGVDQKGTFGSINTAYLESEQSQNNPIVITLNGPPERLISFF